MTVVEGEPLWKCKVSRGKRGIMSNFATEVSFEKIGTAVWYMNPNSDLSHQEDFFTAFSNLFDRAVYKSNGLTPPETCQPIYCTRSLVPNKINVILECFSSDLVDNMVQVKKRFPKTQYIVILTEFLNTSRFGYKAFNCFDALDFLWAFAIQISLNTKKLSGCPQGFNQRFSPPGQLSRTGRIGQIGLKKLLGIRWFTMLTDRMLDQKRVRIAISRVLRATTGEKTRAEFEERLDYLLKIENLVSIWLPIFPSQVRQYRRAGFENLTPLPLLFDSRIIDQIKKRGKGIFYSKNVSSYRRTILNLMDAEFRKQYVGPKANDKIVEIIFQILGGGKYSPEKLLACLEESNLIESDSIEDLQGFIAQIEHCRDNDDCPRQTLEAIQSILPPINEIVNAYQSDRTIALLPQIELYIPKSKKWPYSSPMRTFKALVNGCQPMSFGDFVDHDLESLAQKIDLNSIKQIKALINDASSHLCIDKVENYHRSIYSRALKLNSEIAALAAE